MNNDLRALVHDRLESEGLLAKPWSPVILAACDGRGSLESLLTTGKAAATLATATRRAKSAGAYLASLTVQGFRGIGPKQTLTLTPGPGLTLIVGRNGSGKSSFAEALEVLFTGDSKRWSDRAKVWKDGWRCLHQPHPASIEADVLLEGQGPATITCAWDDGVAFDALTSSVQPKGKKKTTLKDLGWDRALVSYRPFLSYNELGSLLDEGPSKLYDALSLVLGLEDLVNAQAVLSTSRLERQRAFDAADSAREAMIEALTALLESDSDTRASACRDALSSKNWGLEAVESIIAEAATPGADQDVTVLSRALSLDAGDSDRVLTAAESLRNADQKLKAVAGTDAEHARHTAALLETALKFHATHGDSDCPVCGRASALSPTWSESTRREVTRLNTQAAGSDQAHRAVETALRQARELMPPPPKLLAQLFEIGVDGLDKARTEWAEWHAGTALTDLTALANHLETRHDAFAHAIDAVKAAVAAELKRREDRWKPIADELSTWIGQARAARLGFEHVPQLKTAEGWLKDASAEIRNQRFAPIADQAMTTWQHLRQQSNVELGRIELVGAKTSRRVALDVTVDGVGGAALGVMSQGELHALALSLFLPRATLSDSPFRFVVIDDPVQSMDPARVDGLARALEETARTRQVIVFTHDDRLPEALRRLQINTTILGVTRRPKSVVEIRTALDPVRAHIEDALALVQTTELPREILQRLVPGFCRSALEASFIRLYRRKHLSNGGVHQQVEEALRGADTLNKLASLAIYDSKDRAGEVMGRLNKFGGWAGDAFKICKEGVHAGFQGDLRGLIDDSERLAVKIQEIK